MATVSSIETHGSPHFTSFSTVHDVYVSFRSIDTRRIYVDPLCTALNLDGIPTFFYDSELQSGEEMSLLVSSAIDVSKIIIVVLSTNYASSTWCLDELVEILKSKKRTTKQKVFPVFYDVDPEDVRQQTGEFGTAFREHTATKNLEEVETWKAALAAIGCLSGMDKSVFLPSRFTCLAFGIHKTTHENAIVRKLLCVKTLDFTTVICSKKIGALTTLWMAVTKLVFGIQGSSLPFLMLMVPHVILRQRDTMLATWSN